MRMMQTVTWDEFFNIVQKNSELKGKCEALAADYGYAVAESTTLTDDEVGQASGGIYKSPNGYGGPGQGVKKKPTKLL